MSTTETPRADGGEADAILVEGVSPNFFDVTDADFAAGRPFTDVENRVAASVAVLGANVARALFGDTNPVGRTFLLAGERYTAIGRLAPRRGTFFGENRNDNVISLPVRTAQRRFPDAEQTVLYARAKPGLRDRARVTRLASGLPVGGDLEFADEVTLGRALEGRRQIDA